MFGWLRQGGKIEVVRDSITLAIQKTGTLIDVFDENY